MRSVSTIVAAVLLTLVGWAAGARVVMAQPEAQPDDAAESRAKLDQPLSPEMRAIDVTDHRGDRIDTGLRFTDHTGRELAMAELFDGERPVALTLNYYRCRVVCSVQLSGLADALAGMDWVPGEDFRVVTVSIDPRETPADAAKKRSGIVDMVGKGEIEWPFLTGSELEIRALASQLGIGYAYDAEQDQYAHPGVVVFLTPDGRVSRYVYGLAYESLDVKLGLYEAGDGNIGGPVEQLYLSCFSYDPTIGRYGPFAMGIMRIGGTLTALVLGIVLFFLWRRERRHARRQSTDPRSGATTPQGAEAV